MYTIKQASVISNITYAKLWYGGVIGKYERPSLKIGNRFYYSQEQLQQIIKLNMAQSNKENNEHK